MNIKKDWKTYLVVIVLSALALASFIYAAIQTSPLDQYVTNRSCQFIQMGSFSTAVCNDGTSWDVRPFQE